MYNGVSLQMRTVAENAHEEVLCSDVQIQACGDNEPDEADAVCDFLDRWTSGAERWGGDPLSAPFVDDKGEGEVGGLHDGHADVQGFVEVFWFAHLGDDGEEC